MMETTVNSGMTVEKLEAYRGLTSEIKGLREQIDSLYDTYRSPQFISDGGSHSMSANSPTEDAVNKILQLKEKLEVAVGQLQDVENWLSTVDDAEIRAICRHRFILNKSWSQTNVAVYGYPSYCNSRKRIMRYFGKES